MHTLTTAGSQVLEVRRRGRRDELYAARQEQGATETRENRLTTAGYCRDKARSLPICCWRNAAPTDTYPKLATLKPGIFWAGDKLTAGTPDTLAVPVKGSIYLL